MKQDKWTERLEKHLADYREEPKRDLWEGIVLYRCVVGWLLPYL